MKLLSVCISTYEMGGFGPKFLDQSLAILKHQTFQDFEVVISDQSLDGGIKAICEKYQDILDIKYIKNHNRGKTADNINTGIKNASGKLVRILFLDDFLHNNTALEETIKNFDLDKDGWLIAGYIHTKDGTNFYDEYKPKYDDEKILLGKNTVSAPSTVTFKNDGDPILFDDLVWWLDRDFYRRLYQKFGQPKILKSTNVVIRVHENQNSNLLATEKRREQEFQYIIKKYNLHWRWLLIIDYKIKKIKRYLGEKLPGSLVKKYRELRYGHN